jgi:hypothetical protein
VVGLLAVEYVAWRFALGVVLVVLGAALHLVSKGYLRPGRKYLTRTKALTTRGPYRFVRNPFYLANLLAEVGLLVIIGRLWVAVPYLCVWAWVYYKTIKQEERKLLEFFGDIYAEYCRRVPRLFPLPWRIWPSGLLSGPQFSWSNPHIASGKEIYRAVRLVSYPLLLRAMGGMHAGLDWSLSSLDTSIILCAAGFVGVNAAGWFTSATLQRINQRADLQDSGAPKSQLAATNARWAALFLATISLLALAWAA